MTVRRHHKRSFGEMWEKFVNESNLETEYNNRRQFSFQTYQQIGQQIKIGKPQLGAAVITTTLTLALAVHQRQQQHQQGYNINNNNCNAKATK